MIMNIAVIALVLGVGYAWMVRGAFNAMLHALCVFFGGAIALAVWEPLSMLLVSVAPDRGFASALLGASWGLGLIVPFAVVTLLLRLATDKLIPANIKNASATDYAGGALFGLIAGVLSAGILVIGISHMRLPTGFLGHRPVWYHEDRDGYLVDQGSMWIPVADITGAVYKGVSTGSMSTGEPLAKWRPDLESTGFASRIGPGDGAGRNTIKPGSFEPLSRYIVGAENGSTEKSELIGEADYKDIRSQGVGAAYLAGYVVEFGPEAKEVGDGGGQVVVSNGQVRLLVEHDQTGETRTVFPLATISESSEPGRYGRWVYDSKDVFITSTGGKSRVQMAFEFLVPADYDPLAVYVRQIRVPVNEFGGDPETFADADARDTMVPDGSILTGETVEVEYDTAQAVDVDTSDRGFRSVASATASLGTTMSSQTGKQRGLNINDLNEIVGGETTLLLEQVGRQAVSGKSLRVEEFLVGRGQRMIQVKVGDTRDAGPIQGGLLDEGAKNLAVDEPLVLVDTSGNRYEAVGFIFEEENFVLRYTPGSTLTGIQDLPAISRSKTGQDLELLFLVTDGVEIEYFAVDDRVLMRFTPPLPTN